MGHYKILWQENAKVWPRKRKDGIREIQLLVFYHAEPSEELQFKTSLISA